MAKTVKQPWEQAKADTDISLPSGEEQNGQHPDAPKALPAEQLRAELERIVNDADKELTKISRQAEKNIGNDASLNRLRERAELIRAIRVEARKNQAPSKLAQGESGKKEAQKLARRLDRLLRATVSKASPAKSDAAMPSREDASNKAAKPDPSDIRTAAEVLAEREAERADTALKTHDPGRDNFMLHHFAAATAGDIPLATAAEMKKVAKAANRKPAELPGHKGGVPFGTVISELEDQIQNLAHSSSKEDQEQAKKLAERLNRTKKRSREIAKAGELATNNADELYRRVLSGEAGFDEIVLARDALRASISPALAEKMKAQQNREEAEGMAEQAVAQIENVAATADYTTQKERDRKFAEGIAEIDTLMTPADFEPQISEPDLGPEPDQKEDI